MTLMTLTSLLLPHSCTYIIGKNMQNEYVAEMLHRLQRKMAICLHVYSLVALLV